MDASEANPRSHVSAPPRAAMVLGLVLLAAFMLLAIARWATTVGEVQSGSSALALPDMRLDLNTAAVTELRELPGIGPSLAQRIVDHREEHGPWDALDDLIEVHGVGAKTIERLRPFVVVVKPHPELSREQ